MINRPIYLFLSLLALAIAGCGGSASSSTPITSHTAVTYSITPLFNNTTTVRGITVTATLPAGVFPILSSNTTTLKTGATSLTGLNGTSIFTGSYNSATNQVIFDAVNINGISGNFARLTYTANPGISPVKNDFSSFSYLVSGPGGSDLTTRVTKDVNLTPY